MSEKKISMQQVPITSEELREIIKRAESGDIEALPALRNSLECVPELAQCLGGNAAEAAEGALIQAMTGENLTLREAMMHHLAMMRAELAGPNSTSLEKLLVDRIVACWLQVQSADIAAIQTKNGEPQLLEFQERRRTRAHRRLLSAIKTLATVRKLALPVLQLNIGEKQINVAGGVESLVENRNVDGRAEDKVQLGPEAKQIGQE